MHSFYYAEAAERNPTCGGMMALRTLPTEVFIPFWPVTQPSWPVATESYQCKQSTEHNGNTTREEYRCVC
jgi:hypothetical protein